MRRSEEPRPEPVEDRAPEPRRRSLRRRILRALMSAVGVVMIGVMLILTLGPRFFPFQTFYIRSGSMNPTIPIGSLVIATRAPASDLKVGDVIVFDRPDNPGVEVTHRIVGVEVTANGREFITKGDANGLDDPWRIQASGEGWRYKYSIAKAGFVIGYLHGLLGEIGPRGAFVLMITALALYAIWRTPDEEKKTPAEVPATA